jgi:hypothetical protein
MKAIMCAVFVAVVGCTPKPEASAVCKQVEAAGIGTGCKEDKPHMLSGRAKAKWTFDLVNVAGKTGQVLSFADAEAHQATVKAFEAAGMLAGPHRYGSEKALIFVQMNDGASLDDGKKVKALVDAL